MTSFVSREVLVPLIGGEARGAVCRIIAGGAIPPIHPARLDPEISELLESGLYQAGQQAQAALRRIKLSRRWFDRQMPVALSVLNPGDVVGLVSENSASAEFGLALVKLMYVTQSVVGRVIASGKLQAKVDETDASVLPVTHLRAKFELIKQYFGQPGAPPPPKFFFTPLTDIDRQPIRTKYAKEILELAAMGVSVEPIADLWSAAKIIGAAKLATHPYLRWFRRVLALVGSLIAAALAGYWMWSRPIELQFLTVALPDGRVAATPARVRDATSDELRFLPTCMAADGLPALRPGDSIAFKVGSFQEPIWFQPFQRRFYLVVAVSDRTGAKVLPIPGDHEGIGVRPGDAVALKLRVEEGADERTLVGVIARRSRPFDTVALERALRGVLEPLRDSERISATRNFLKSVAPGYIEYIFRSAGEGSCLEK